MISAASACQWGTLCRAYVSSGGSRPAALGQCWGVRRSDHPPPYMGAVSDAEHYAALRLGEGSASRTASVEGSTGRPDVVGRAQLDSTAFQ